MTAKEIEAAREAVEDVITNRFGDSVLKRAEARRALETLCAAARDDSLVGKRVRIIRNGAKGLEGTVLAKSLVRDYRWFVSWDDGIEGPCSRDDFEVLEGGDAE